MSSSDGLTEKTGTIVAIRGSVVDIKFEDRLPPIHTRLNAGPQEKTVIEVATHLDTVTVRGIALTPTQGLNRGALSPIRVAP